MSIHVFDVHLSSVVYKTPPDKGDLATVQESSSCLCPTAAMPNRCFRAAEAVGEPCPQFRFLTFESPGVSIPGEHP